MKNIFYVIGFLSLVSLLEARKHTIKCCIEKQKVHASRFTACDERKAAMDRRMACGCMRTMMQKNHSLTSEQNGDEKRIPHYAAQFSKGLEHDAATGVLTDNGQRSYVSLVNALTSGSQKTYNSIERAPASLQKLVNPQGSAVFSLEGTDSSLIPIESFPILSSEKAAAQLIENYLLALCRDVFFEDYGTGLRTDADGKGGSLTLMAARVLNDLGSAYTGPRTSDGTIDTTVLFRGNNKGALVGPYGSQFLYQPLTICAAKFPPAVGIEKIQEKFLKPQVWPYATGRNFGIAWNDFIDLENGGVPQSYEKSDYSDTPRHIVNGRDLSTIVHWDLPYEAAYNALIVLFANRFPFSPSSPYMNGSITNEGPLVTMGYFDAFAMLGAVTSEAAKHAWAHKWRAQRALRPEAFAGLVHLSKVTGSNPYHINNMLFQTHAGIDLLALVKEANEIRGASTYLLSQAYPEASPLHPSYPAGHATIAGACITVIKAIFDDKALLSSHCIPAKPDPVNPAKLVPLQGEGEHHMTVGSELNKLASNIALGRNWAGIHYRIDADNSMKLGEAVAIAFLQDRAACFTEETFRGFELTKIDGTRIRITATLVCEI